MKHDDNFNNFLAGLAFCAGLAIALILKALGASNFVVLVFTLGALIGSVVRFLRFLYSR